jgi:alkanesulfonate monooxygenase SsuD/methylene tetrahydromethanopterin reductase-like flavin-dependent oxidoreductase (luciferase family)
MPRTDLTDEEHAAVAAALRRLIDDDKFPFSPRLKPLKSALAKLAPPKPKAPLPPPIAGASEAASAALARFARIVIIPARKAPHAGPQSECPRGFVGIGKPPIWPLARFR